MVGGGVIIGLARKSDHTTVHVRENYSTDQCCVDIKEYRINGGAKIQVDVGDQIWWQGNLAMWTPKGSQKEQCGEDFDIVLLKIGYTHHSSHAMIEG